VIADERGQGAGEGGQQHPREPSWLAAGSLFTRKRRSSSVGRTSSPPGTFADVRAREGADAVAVEPVPADRAPTRAEAAANRLHPPASRVADRSPVTTAGCASRKPTRSLPRRAMDDDRASAGRAGSRVSGSGRSARSTFELLPWSSSALTDPGQRPSGLRHPPSGVRPDQSCSILPGS
jgi:hypothetical protein